MPDMVFTADQGVVSGTMVLMSNFHYPEREKEREPYEAWFKKHNYEIKYLREGDYFEGGGECLHWRDGYFMGTGFRSETDSIQWVTKRLNKQIIELELVNEYYYHLDTCLLPINDDVIFYYPKAFSPESIELLKDMVPHLIEFSTEEASGFCANSVVTGNTVISQIAPDSFCDKLKEINCEIIETDVSEFIKSGGGIHCLTNILE